MQQRNLHTLQFCSLHQVKYPEKSSHFCAVVNRLFHAPLTCFRSTARISNGQRVALMDIEEARLEHREDSLAFVYEYVSQARAAARRNACRLVLKIPR